MGRADGWRAVRGGLEGASFVGRGGAVLGPGPWPAGWSPVGAMRPNLAGG
jgi:hypothetical protein